MSDSSKPGNENCMRNHLSLYITLIQLLYLCASSNVLSSTCASYSNTASFYLNLKFHVLILLSQHLSNLCTRTVEKWSLLNYYWRQQWQTQGNIFIWTQECTKCTQDNYFPFFRWKEKSDFLFHVKRKTKECDRPNTHFFSTFF